MPQALKSPYLCPPLDIEGEDVFTPPRFTLADEEDPMSSRPLELDKLSSFDSRDGAMEPREGQQVMIRLLLRWARLGCSWEEEDVTIKSACV